VNSEKSPSTNEAATLIRQLKLLPHPEGGWYREVFRSNEIIQIESIAPRYRKPHCFSTSIYFLIESNDFSAFHRIRSDETWHFYAGSPVTIYTLLQDGTVSEATLGNNLAEGQLLQFTIERNTWFAARIKTEGSFALVGCTVSPGFEFEDFELGKRHDLTDLFPQHAAMISGLTRE